eukprot:scaffold303488_cov37-Prasinocladus_malaysianus.AAC.1
MSLADSKQGQTPRCTSAGPTRRKSSGEEMRAELQALSLIASTTMSESVMEQKISVEGIEVNIPWQLCDAWQISIFSAMPLQEGTGMH